MDNDNFSFLADAESSITGDKTEGYTPKEQELIHQLVQERLGKKNAIEFESLDDYVVPPKMFFSMIKKGRINEKVFLRYVRRLLYIAFFRMLIKTYFL